MDKSKRLIISTVAAALFGILFLVWIASGFEVSLSKLPLSHTKILESDVSYVEAGSAEEQKLLTLKLTEDFQKEQTLLFKTTHTKVHVQVDGEEVYCNGCDKTGPSFLKSPGTLWHLVQIPGGDTDREVTILLTAVYDDFFGNKTIVYYGSEGGCVLELFLAMLPIVIINCIVLFAGFICLVLHFAIDRKQRHQELSIFLSLGIFSFLVVGWSLCQSGFLQFLIPNGRVLYFVDFFTFYLFAVPFNMMIYGMSKSKFRKGYIWISSAYLLNMAAAIILQLIGWKDWFELISITHGIMAVNAVYIYISLFYETRKEKNPVAVQFRIPLYIIVLFGVAELVSYYVNDFRKTSVFIPIGTMLFITMLVWIQMIRHHNMLMEEQKAEYFEKLANMDMLTGAFSRNAYENTLKELEKEECTGRIDIYTFDINEMKYINDYFGHDKGDEALRVCYRCICCAFGQTGKCFRTGGDEFVFISDQGKNLEDARLRFEEMLEKETAALEYPFSVAVGFASYDPFDQEAFREALRRSDEQMYVNKRETRKRRQENATQSINS